MNDKMKILILTETFPDENGSQAAVFIFNQAVCLKKAGVDVSVLYIDLRSIRRKRRLFASNYSIDGVKVYRYAVPVGPLKRLLKIVTPWALVHGYRYYLRNEAQPDLIHAHFGNAGRDAALIKEKYRIPYIITEHDSSLVSDEAIDTEKLKMLQEGYHHAGKIICVSKALEEKVNTITSIPSQVLYNFIPDYFNYHPQSRSSVFTYIFVGNLIERKGIIELLEAFYQFKKRIRISDCSL